MRADPRPMDDRKPAMNPESRAQPLSDAETVMRLQGEGEAAPEVRGRSIGDILARLRNLSAEEVEQVLAQQRNAGSRFGEAAVSLGLVTEDDVLVALSQQFHYPYAAAGQRSYPAELVMLNQPFSAKSEAFRHLRSQLAMKHLPAGSSTALALISPARGDGKTYAAANLAISLAQLGERTLLIDADMRSPRLHQLFALGNPKEGLSTILSGRIQGQAIVPVEGVPSLFVLPVGATPPNPLELVERPAFGLLIEELRRKFTYIVLDTPAAEVGSDASVIAARCGLALVVARRHRSSVNALRDLTQGLRGSPTELAGVVVNDF